MRKYKITMAVHGELIGVLEGEVEAENEEIEYWNSLCPKIRK